MISLNSQSTSRLNSVRWWKIDSGYCPQAATATSSTAVSAAAPRCRVRNQRRRDGKRMRCPLTALRSVTPERTGRRRLNQLFLVLRNRVLCLRLCDGDVDSLLDLSNALAQPANTHHFARPAARPEVHRRHEVRHHSELILQIGGERRQVPADLLDEARGGLVLLQRQCVLLGERVNALEEHLR